MPQSIPIGPATVLNQNVVYALPSKTVSVSTTAACETSIDQVSWATLTSGSNTSAGFIRCTTTSPTVICRSISTGGGSGSGGLPTAPLGQVMISQGNGIPPIFSNSFKLINTSAPVDQRTWNFTVASNGEFDIVGQTDLGVNQNKKFVMDPFSGGISTIYGGIGALNGSIGIKFINPIPITFSDLVASGGQGGVGALATISDSTTNTVGSTISGGGVLVVLGRWNGTVWKVIQ